MVNDRVCDYIAKRLHDEGVCHVYGLVGGGCGGLNDGFICNKNIEYIGFHHEQGAGHAAVGSARTNGKLSVVNVTTGCGGTNALTSCLNAWQESLPVLFLSGNTKLNTISSYINKTRGLNLRKYGIQEHDIVSTVKNLTKYAVLIEDVNDVSYEVEKAISIAKSGRPGPVWIDIPSDIQTAKMPETIKTFIPEENPQICLKDIASAVDCLSKSKRPIVVLGGGVAMSGSRNLAKNFIEKNKIPFVTNFLTRDLFDYNHPLNIGMMGIKGNRCANFAIQNADCLIVLGSSMNITHIGYDAKTFSPYSKKIMIDIDHSELNKNNIQIDYPILGDVKDFLTQINQINFEVDTEEWTNKCSHWKSKWPIYLPELHRSDADGLNLYEIVESINRNMRKNDLILADAGQPCYICSTNLKPNEDQRYMVQAAQGDMGYAIPAIVGINCAEPKYNIIACIGEGSFHTNMQELAVIKQRNIPAKIFVINNDGYMSIKQTQMKFFGGRLHAVSKSTGIYFADIKKVAEAFELDYFKISNNEELDSQMKFLMSYNKPVIVEFIAQHMSDVLPAQAIKPNGKQGYLHDMAPFLSEEELNKEMIVKI